jgi:hypothetical protein
MSELSPELRALVAASKNASRPTEADSARVLAALRICLGNAATVGADAAKATVTSNTTGLLFGKVSAIAFAGLALIGGLWFFTARARQAASSESNAAPSAAVTIQANTALVPSATLLSATGLTAPEASEISVALRPTPNDVEARPHHVRDRLAEEVALLSRAETALHSGNAAGALEVLNEHERKFRDGLLAEERIAARIQALCALGRKTEADAQLAQLSPKSLHGKQSGRACGSSVSP